MYIISKVVNKNIRIRTINIGVALVVALASLGGTVTLFTQTASASPATTVTAASPQGWTASTASGGLVSYAGAADAPLGNGAAKLTTNSTNDSVARLTHSFDVPLSSVTSLSYETKQLAAADTANGNATLRINIDTNNDGAADDQLMYEPYYNGFNGNTDTGWQTWDVTHGKFWSNNELSYNGLGGVSAGSYASNFTLSDVLHDYPNAKLVGLVLSMGTWNPSQQVLVDNLVLNDNVYDFEPAVVAPCSATSTVRTTNLSSWDLSQTRATGHNQLNVDGLHIWTEGATSTDKAAGYYATDFPLANLGDKTIAQSIDYAATTGIAPGLQLKVDFNGDGTTDGTLVGEAVYGNNWWLADADHAQFVKDGAPHQGGGYGSQWYGTPNDWLGAFPNARVKAIGYSLGSGVHGDGVIKSISLGCTDYTFGIAAPTLIAPANGNTVNGASITNSWTAVDGAVKYEYQSFNDAAGHNQRFDGIYTTTSKTAANVADGTVFYWRVRAIDSTGAAGDWSNGGNLWKVVVDSTRPSTPTLLTPGNNTYTTSNDFYFTWTDSSDSGSPVTYEFISSKSSHTSSGVLDTGIWDNLTDGNVEQRTLTNPKIHSTGASDGDWYWQVRAIDAAGNKSAWTAPWKVTIDTHTPDVPSNLAWKDNSNTAITNGGYTNSYNGTASWQDTSGDVNHYIYKYWNDISSSPYHSEATAYTTTVGGTSLPGVFNQGEGTHHFCVAAVDAAGNTSACSTPFTVTYDSTAPVAHLAAPVSSAVRGTVTISGTVIDANPDHYYLVVKDSHGAVVAGPGTVNAANVADYNWDTTGLTDGTYTIDLEARDKANNKDASSVDTKTVTVDNTAPVTPVANPAGGTYDSARLVSLNSTDSGSGLAGIYYTVDGSDPTTSSTRSLYDNTAGGILVDSTTAVTTIKAVAYDNAGNASGVLTSAYTITQSSAPHLNAFPALTLASVNAGFGGGGAANPQGGGTSGVAGAGNTGGGTGGGQGQVLGAATNSPNNDSSTGSDANNKSGNVGVEGASTNKDNKKNTSAFLGLGWWWLLVLALAALLIYGLTRGANGTDKNTGSVT